MSLTYATRPGTDVREPRPERRDPRNERRHPRNERRRVRPEDTAYAASRLALAAQYFDAVATARTAGPDTLTAQYFDSAAAVRLTMPEVDVASSDAPEPEDARPSSVLQRTIPLPWTAGIIAGTFGTAVLVGLGLGG